MLKNKWLEKKLQTLLCNGTNDEDNVFTDFTTVSFALTKTKTLIFPKNSKVFIIKQTFVRVDLNGMLDQL